MSYKFFLIAEGAKNFRDFLHIFMSTNDRGNFEIRKSLLCELPKKGYKTGSNRKESSCIVQHKSTFSHRYWVSSAHLLPWDRAIVASMNKSVSHNS